MYRRGLPVKRLPNWLWWCYYDRYLADFAEKRLVMIYSIQQRVPTRADQAVQEVLVYEVTLDRRYPRTSL